MLQCCGKELVDFARPITPTVSGLNGGTTTCPRIINHEISIIIGHYPPLLTIISHFFHAGLAIALCVYIYMCVRIYIYTPVIFKPLSTRAHHFNHALLKHLSTMQTMIQACSYVASNQTQLAFFQHPMPKHGMPRRLFMDHLTILS